MPPCLWTVIALFLSAGVSAAIARAIGRARRSELLVSHGPPPVPAPGQDAPLPTPLPVPPGNKVEPKGTTQAGPGRELRLTLDAEAGPQVQVTVESLAPGGRGTILYRGVVGVDDQAAKASDLPRGLRRTWASITAALARGRPRTVPAFVTLEVALATGAAVLYMLTRLWAIDSFPVFFYSDEVNYVLFGEQIYERGLVGEDGSWPAIYVLWDTNRWGPAVGVYLYGLTALVFGKHIWVARATGALITLGGVLAVACILKDHFRSRFWWASILLAASIPAWFLYSRTVFDFVAAASLYAVFLLAYLRYRFHSSTSLGLAAVAGAATFYSNSNMMLVMGALAACLLVSDFRYHVLHRRIWLRTLPILALLAIPLVEFRILHPEAIRANLSSLASYWVEDLPLAAKLLRYVQTYLHGLSPTYWFAPEAGTGTLPVQFIPGAGHLGFALLPFVGLGLFVAFRNLRSPRYRLVLLSALVVPAGSALDTIEITRVLAMVIPALLLSIIGLEQLGNWLKAIPQGVQTAAVAIVLSVLGLARLVGAMVYGPTWPTDYGLEGAQFGAKVLYEGTIPALLAEDPETTLIMNTTWANNAHIYPRFFLSQSDQERVRFSNVRDYLDTILPLEPGTIIAMLPEEYADAVASPMLGRVDVIKTVYRPDGEPGFYFAHIAYAADAERVAQEYEAIRFQLVESQVDILGQPTAVLHSRLADGSIANLFDGSTESLVRGDNVNPFQVEIRFSQPRQLDGIRVTTGSFGDFSVSVTVTLPGVGEPLVVSERYRDLGPDPTVSLSLPSAGAAVSSLRLEVTDNAQGPTGVIHVREIALY